MWTPLANAAQSGDDRPPPISAAPGSPGPSPRPAARSSGAGSSQGPRGAAEGVEQPPPGLDDDRVGQVLEPGRQGETRQSVGQGLGHRRVRSVSGSTPAS